MLRLLFECFDILHDKNKWAQKYVMVLMDSHRLIHPRLTAHAGELFLLWTYNGLLQVLLCDSTIEWAISCLDEGVPSAVGLVNWLNSIWEDGHTECSVSRSRWPSQKNVSASKQTTLSSFFGAEQIPQKTSVASFLPFEVDYLQF